ncbi:MAG: type VI secretion system baseplate subunit TssK [Deltaproteobacteria bacterium]|nr:type VI secretion system baseplate subunit TssK [Deltaproteobacteria bacterium]
MNIKKQLFWHQGLLLQPQHFQYMDMVQNNPVFPMMEITNPYLYGVINIKHSQSSLLNDVFETESLELLLSDGTLVDSPENAVVKPRSFAGFWTETLEPFTIYAGVKKLNKKGGNVTVVSSIDEAEDVKTRYISLSEPEEFPDLHQEGPFAQMKTLIIVVKLFFEDEVKDAGDYDLIPVAQLIKGGDEVKHSPDFIPPSLHISSSSVLMNKIFRIRDELTGRARQLEEYKISVGDSGKSTDVRTIPYRFSLQLLSHYGPILYHYTETHKIHPFQVYGVLRQMVGGLSTLSDRVSFLGETGKEQTSVLPYKHNNLGECFNNICGVIELLLNEISIESESVVTLEKVEEGKYQADIPAELFAPQNHFFLGIRTASKFEEMIDTFTNFSKTGSVPEVDIYVERSLPGLTLKFLRAHPEGIPKRQNANYFEIDRNDPAMKSIQDWKNIVLLWDQAPEDMKVEFIVLRR